MFDRHQNKKVKTGQVCVQAAKQETNSALLLITRRELYIHRAKLFLLASRPTPMVNRNLHLHDFESG